jgi:hypothetical protein
MFKLLPLDNNVCGLSSEFKEDIQRYFYDVYKNSIFNHSVGVNKSSDFSKALHIQDRIHLLAKFLSSTPDGRLEICSSFQKTEHEELRGERKGRFILILIKENIRELNKIKFQSEDKINEIFNAIDGSNFSAKVLCEIYDATQNILKSSQRPAIHWESHFWNRSDHKREQCIDRLLDELHVMVSDNDGDANLVSPHCQ